MRVPMVRREQKVIQPFAEEDITALLAACNPTTYVGSRMKAMVFFLLDTGVRSSELGSSHLDDVLLDQHRVRVLQGKGRKQRWTAISDVALEALRGYLDGFRGWSDGPLFQTVDGWPLRNHHMNVMFTRHGLKAGVRQVNPHRFRHTFGTWAIRASAREFSATVSARAVIIRLPMYALLAQEGISPQRMKEARLVSPFFTVMAI